MESGQLALWIVLVYAAFAVGQQLPNIEANPNDFFNLPTCNPVQSFILGRKYTYSYEGIMESYQGAEPNGAMLRCSIEMSIPYKCAGTLRATQCQVLQATPLANGTLAYTTPSPLNNQAVKMMSRYPIYFHFGDGKIQRIFAFRSEPSDVLNMKRAILSALQVDFVAFRNTAVNQKIQYPESNIFGAGNVTATVRSLSVGAPRRVVVQRSTLDIVHPYSPSEFGHMHTSFQENDITNFANDLVMSAASNIERNSAQECDYTLERGRVIEQVTCSERRAPTTVQGTFLQPIMELLVGATGVSTVETIVRLNMKRISEVPMTKEDRITPGERTLIQTSYNLANVMFEQQWREITNGELVNFDPVATFDSMVRDPRDPYMAGKFAKLAHLISTLPASRIQSIWSQVSGTFTGKDLETATALWVQILNRCSSIAQWCHPPVCNAAIYCQQALSSFISVDVIPTWPAEILTGVTRALVSFKKPAPEVVSAALMIARTRPTPLTILTLGKVIALHANTWSAPATEPIVTQAVAFLISQLNRDCSLSSDVIQHGQIMLIAVKSLSVLPQSVIASPAQFVACVRNVNAPKPVALEAANALKDRALDPTMRAQIVEILASNERPIELRLACYLYIINHDPTPQEISRVQEIVELPATPKAVQYYVKEHLKSQIRFRGTQYCTLKPSLIKILKKSMHKNNWIGVDRSNIPKVEERKYSTSKPIFVPYLNREIICHVRSNVVMPENAFIPLFVNVSIMGEMSNKNVSLLDLSIDMTKMISIIQPLFGSNGIFPEPKLSQLLSLPIGQLLAGATNQLPPLNAQELAQLSRVQNEASMAYTMAKTQSNIPVFIKVLGTQIDLNSILQIPFIRELNLMRMWQLSENLATGINLSTLVADETLHAHVAVPTSIGLPHVTHLNLAYYLNSQARLTAQIRNMILYGRGNVQIASKPILRTTFLLSQKIQLPGGATCGGGYVMTLGHSSDVNVSVKVEPTQVQLNVAPLPATTEIISFSSTPLRIVNGALTVPAKQPRPACESSCLFGNCRAGTSIKYQACLNQPMTLGLFVESDQRMHYDVIMQSGELVTRVEGESLECKGVEISVATKASINAARNEVLSLAAKYLPTLSQLRFEYSAGTKLPWSVILKSAWLNADKSVSAVATDNYIAGIDVTSPDGSYVTKNELSVARRQPTASHFLDMFRYFAHHSEEADTYTVDGKMELPVVGVYSLSGMIKNEVINSPSYTLRMKIQKGLISNLRATPLCHVTVKTTPISEGPLNGQRTTASIESIQIPALPYREISIQLTTMNDTAGHSKAIVHCQALRKDTNPTEFFNWRMNIRRTVPNSPTPVAINTTFTCPTWQAQFDLAAPNMTFIDNVVRLVVPEKKIPASLMTSTDQDAIRITETSAIFNPTCITARALLARSPEDETKVKVEFTTAPSKGRFLRWIKPDKTSYYAFATLSPNVCLYCHDIQVRLPYLNFYSRVKGLESSFWNNNVDAGFELHRDLMPYLGASSNLINLADRFVFTDGWLRVGILEQLSGDRMEFGYRLGARKFNAKITASFKDPVAHVKTVLTCTRCVPLFDVTFINTLEITYQSLAQSRLTTLAASDGFTQHMSIQHSHVGLANISTFINTEAAWKRTELRRLVIGSNFKYTALRPSLLTVLLSSSEFEYPININVTVSDTPAHPGATEYNLGLRLGPSMIWDGTVSKEEVTSERFPLVCVAGTPCVRTAITLTKNTNCANFSVFYAGGSPQLHAYTTTHCAQMQLEHVSSGSRRYNTSIRVVGDGDPSFLINNLFILMENIPEKHHIHANWEIASPIMSVVPTTGKIGLLMKPKVFRIEADLGRMKIDILRRIVEERDESIISLTLNDLAIECELHKRTSDSNILDFAIPRCSLRFVPLAEERIYNSSLTARVSSLWDFRISSEAREDRKPLFNAAVACSSVDCRITILGGTPVNRINPINITSIFTPASVDFAAKITESFNSRLLLKRNNMMLLFVTPKVVINASAIMLPELRVNAIFNIPGVMTNSLEYASGQLRSLNSVGHQLRIPGFQVPYSWTCNFFNTQEAPLNLNIAWNAGVSTTYGFVYYYGTNDPSIPSVHVASAPPTSKILRVRFSQAACSSKVLLDNAYVWTPLMDRLVSAELNANSNAWIFDSHNRLGEMTIAAKYDAAQQTIPVVNITATISESGQISMNYALGPLEAEDAIFLNGATKIIYGNPTVQTSPSVALATTFNIVQSAFKAQFDIDLRTAGYGENNLVFFCRNNIYNAALTAEMQLRAKETSMRYLVAYENNALHLLFSYPNTRDADLRLDLDVTSGGLLTVRDARFKIGRHVWSLTGMTAQVLVDTEGRANGLDVRDVTLRRICTCSPKVDCECALTIVGHALMQIGGEWNVDFHDTKRELIIITFVMQPGPKITMNHRIYINSKVMLLDSAQNALLSATEIYSNASLIMELMNPVSGKLMPFTRTTNNVSYVSVNGVASGVASGFMTHTTYQWDLWYPRNPVKTTFIIRQKPNAEYQGSEVTVNFAALDWKTSNVFKYSDACLANYNVFGYQVCSPRLLYIDSNVDLPVIKASVRWDWTEARVAGHNLLSIFPLAVVEGTRPLFNYTEYFDLRWTASQLLYGWDNYTQTLTWPIEHRSDWDFKMDLTEDGSSTVESIIVRLPNSVPHVITFSPHLPNGARIVRVTRNDALLFSTKVTFNRCMTGLPTWLCIPTAITLSDIDVNLPVTSVLRDIPMLRDVIPDNGMFDLTLEGSAATWSVTCHERSCVTACHVELNGPSMPENLVMDSTLTMTLETCTWRTTLNRWNAMTMTTFILDSMAVTSETTLNAPFITYHTKMVCPTMLMPREVIFKVKTIGDLETVIPIDIDLEYTWPTSTAVWKVDLRSCAIEIPSFIKANVSMTVDSTYSNVALRWSLATQSTPLLNHVMGLNLVNTIPGQEWTLAVLFSNIVFWSRANVKVTPNHVALVNSELGLPDNSNGVTISWDQPPTAGQPTAFVLSYTDRDMVYRCTATPVQSPANTLAFRCVRKEAPRPHKRVVEVTVAEFQIDASFIVGYDLPATNWAKVIRFVATFNYSRCLDQPWIAETLRTRFHVTDPDLCARFSTYISAECAKIQGTINREWNPELAYQVMGMAYQKLVPLEYVKHLVDYLRPLAKYMNSNYFRWALRNENDNTFISMDITCPKCDKVLASFKIRMWTDDRNRPMASINCTTPIMTTATTVMATIPIRPVTYSFTMTEYSVTTACEYSDHNELMSLTATARFSTAGSYRCSAERGSSTAMSMPCICNKLEGETLGPEVARFNIPILFLSETYSKIYNLATLDNLMHISSTIKQELGIHNQEMSENVDRYVSNMAVYIVELTHQMMAAEANSIPIWRLDLSYAQLLFSVDIPTDQLKFGFNVDVTSVTMPELEQHMKVHVLQKANDVILRIISNNQMMKITANWNIRTMRFVSATILMPMSSECINVTTSTNGNDIIFNFNDVNGSPYTCVLTTTGAMTFTCHVTRNGNRVRVCTAQLPQETRTWANLVRAGILVTPMVYRAALRPEQFKRDLKREFQFVFYDDEARDVLCNGISNKCRNYVNFVNQRTANYIKKISADPMTEYYFEAMRSVLENLLIADIVPCIITGHRLTYSSSRDIWDSILEACFERLADGFQQIGQYYNKIKKSLILPALPNLRFDIENYIQNANNYAENVYLVHFMCNKLASQPNQIQPAFNYIYQRMNFTNMIWNLFVAIQGQPAYYNFWTPEINQVVAYNGEYIQLPVLPANSQCTYIYATDPIANRFSILAKGQNIILALPGKLVEPVTARTAYVTALTSPNSTRTLVNLPYVSDDVICLYEGNTARCDTPNFSLTAKFLGTNKVVRIIKLLNPELNCVAGAIGAYSNAKMPLMLLPNGDKASSPSQLLAAYSLSQDASCKNLPMTRSASLAHPVVVNSEICKHQVSPSMMTSYPKQYAAYMKACSLGEASYHPIEACLYQEAFSIHMSLMWQPRICCPKPVRRSLYVLLSLSRDANAMSASKIVRKILVKARHSNIHYDAIGLVTYGGRGDAEQPRLVMLHQLSESSMRQAIRSLQLNGAPYHYQSTEIALRYAAQELKSTVAEAKNLVVVAPETVQENIGMSAVAYLTEDLAGDMTSVFLYSRLTQNQCRQLKVDLVLNTGGVCVSKSTRVMVEFITDRNNEVVRSYKTCKI